MVWILQPECICACHLLVFVSFTWSISYEQVLGCSFWDRARVLISPGWPGILYVIQSGFKLVFLLPQSPECPPTLSHFLWKLLFEWGLGSPELYEKWQRVTNVAKTMGGLWTGPLPAMSCLFAHTVHAQEGTDLLQGAYALWNRIALVAAVWTALPCSPPCGQWQRVVTHSPVPSALCVRQNHTALLNSFSDSRTDHAGIF
jgi:hypothetical protein